MKKGCSWGIEQPFSNLYLNSFSHANNQKKEILLNLRISSKRRLFIGVKPIQRKICE